MTDLSDHPVAAYAAPGLDEFVDADGMPRPHWTHLASVIGELGPSELKRRQADLVRLLDGDGVTYHHVGADRSVRWPVDPIPLVISSPEWATIESAVSQRAVLLDLVLRDLYGPRTLLRRGLLPPEIVDGHHGYLRSLVGTLPENEMALTVYAVDLGRRADGTHCVIGDHTQVPSGFGYALANRVAVSRVFPSLYRDSEVHRVAPFFRSLRSHLQYLGSKTSDDPRIVVLSPGSRSETSYEHAALASTLGLDLVEAPDLVVQHGRVHLRALGRLEPIDVILRRVDGAWCDPLELRPDSQLGVPGLVEVCRRQNVAVVNSLGSSVLETPALAHFLPAISKALLGEDLELPSATTYWCGDDAHRSHVLANLDSLVLKPLHRQAGPTSVFGADIRPGARDVLRDQILARPWEWAAQEPVELATAPTLVSGSLVPRRTLLRTFAVSRGESYAVMSGGLTRVAQSATASRITSQAGARSKDTWVLATEPEQLSQLWLRPGAPVLAADPGSSMPARAAENLFWLGRYAERAEATTRLLRVVDDRRSDFEGGSRGVAAGIETVTMLLRALTRITATEPGFVGDDAVDLLAEPDDELFSIVSDETRIGTLAHALGRVAIAAESVRDQLSVDTWVVLSSLEQHLRTLADASIERREVVQGALSQVLQALLAFHGLVAESMVRDPGWYFLDAGRRIERAIQLSRLLRHLLVDEVDPVTASLLYESILSTSESIITYRRRYRSRAQVETMLDLLVADPGNPRSLRYQVDRLGEATAALPGVGHDRLTDAERRVLEVSTTLRVADTGTLASAVDNSRPALADFLDRVVVQLQLAADAVAEANFTKSSAPRALNAQGRNAALREWT